MQKNSEFDVDTDIAAGEDCFYSPMCRFLTLEMLHLHGAKVHL